MVRTASRRVGALALMALVASLGACSTSTGSGSSSGPIRIGMVVPLTGPLSALGTGDQQSAEAVVAALNARGGILGRKVELKIVDDKTDVTESVKQYNQMISDPSVVAMLASSMAPAAAAVGPSAKSRKVPTIALSPVDAYADGSNPYAFTSPPRPAVYAQSLVDYWKSTGVKTVAVAYSAEDVFGPTGRAATKQAVEAAGMRVVLDEPFSLQGNDFSPLVLKVTQAKPDAFVMWGAGPSTVIMTKQLAGKGVPVYATGAQASDLFLRPAGSAAEGMIAATTAAMAGDDLPQGAFRQAVDEVRKAWATKSPGQYPPEFAFGGAAGVQLLEAAIKKAGSTDRQAVRDALEKLDVLTANGHYRYSATDHMGLDERALAIMQVKGGRWVATPYAKQRLAADYA